MPLTRLTEDDANVFCAIAFNHSDEAMSLAEMVANADYVFGALTLEATQQGVIRLWHLGLFEIWGKKVQLTENGRDIWDRAKDVPGLGVRDIRARIVSDLTDREVPDDLLID